jgi:hypothetical protein
MMQLFHGCSNFWQAGDCLGLCNCFVLLVVVMPVLLLFHSHDKHVCQMLCSAVMLKQAAKCAVTCSYLLASWLAVVAGASPFVDNTCTTYLVGDGVLLRLRLALPQLAACGPRQASCLPDGHSSCSPQQVHDACCELLGDPDDNPADAT